MNEKSIQNKHPVLEKRLFIDMDGTLARFHDEVNYLERMFEKDFFRNLKPFDNLVKAVKLLTDLHPKMEVFVLSAAVDGEPPYCRVEKHLWLANHLPEVDKKNIIFTDIGHPKADYIPGGISPNDYLLDDYNVGLKQWEIAGGSAIKCKNNINHKGLIGALWDGALIENEEKPDTILKNLLGAMNVNKVYESYFEPSNEKPNDREEDEGIEI